MKIAIIVLTILAIVFFATYKLLETVCCNSLREIMKMKFGGHSWLFFFCGLSRLLFYLAAIASAALLMIKYMS